MRIVVKVGTQVIANKRGLDLQKIKALVSDIAKVMRNGHEVVLVSSGAIGAGHSLFNSKHNVNKKILAAIGQPLLMHDYIREAKKNKLSVGQFLILSDDFTNKEHFKNFVFNIEGTLELQILPIINENDVMKREDLAVGDNDKLAAMVAVGLQADKLVILTNKNGFYDSDPDKNPKAKLIKKIDRVTTKIERLCFKSKSALGRGGMISKIEAAKYATERGVETFIGNGAEKGIIEKAFSKDFPGTIFASKKFKKK